MSSGHSRVAGSVKTLAQLYRVRGEGDTPELLTQPFEVVETKDVPDAGGISLDRKRVYIDRSFAAKIRSGEVAVLGMTPDNVIYAVALHEHTEASVLFGDNPVDTYDAAHEFATAAEHEFVRGLGVDPDVYEAALKVAIAAAESQDPPDPPLDLWCGPYLDDPDANDERVLGLFRAKGVADAFKTSKKTLHYGVGPDECEGCRHFDGAEENGALGLCEIVCGMVRWDRHCDAWSDTALAERVWSLTEQG